MINIKHWILTNKNLWLVIFILLLSLSPRVWELTTYPPTIVDEPAYLRDISQMIAEANYAPSGMGWDFSQAKATYYPTILLINVFGITDQLLALRIVSVLFSLLALIPFFLIVQLYTNRLTAFCAAILLSFSYYYLQFSRVGWGVIYILSLGLFLMYFSLLAKKTSRTWLYILTGLVAALIFYGYRAGQIYIVSSFIYLTHNFVSIKQKSAFPLLITLLVFLLVAFPWINQIARNRDLYNLRFNVVSINNASLPYHNLTSELEIYNYQLMTAIRSWIFLEGLAGGGSENQRYLPINFPPVNLFIRASFWIGLIIALKNLRRFWIWLVIFVLGVIIGQILTIDPPNGARGLILLPVIYLFAALSWHTIILKLHHNSFIKVCLLILTLLFATLDFAFYQDWMSWIKV